RRSLLDLFGMNASQILFVDDNAALASVYEISLGDHGFRVTTAGSGNEAVNLCLHCDAFVAIVDLRMPGMDGPETIAALKTHQPKLKIIAISGQGLVPYFSRLASLGVRHFLPKPFRIDDLLGSIQDLIGGLKTAA